MPNGKSLHIFNEIVIPFKNMEIYDRRRHFIRKLRKLFLRKQN